MGKEWDSMVKSQGGDGRVKKKETIQQGECFYDFYFFAHSYLLSSDIKKKFLVGTHSMVFYFVCPLPNYKFGFQ